MRSQGTNRFKILFVEDLRQFAARESLRGVLRFAALHDDWELRIAYGHPANDPGCDPSETACDGLIADCSWCQQPDSKRLATRPKAAVFLELPLPEPLPTRNFGQVLCDNRSIAHAAADFFLKRGFKNFAYVGSPHGYFWSHERFEHFSRRIRAHGHQVSAYCHQTPTGDWAAEQDNLQSWLLGLPKPCAVFAAYDQRAMHVINGCRQVGIDVPSQVAVLGVDDDTIICEQTVPSISSVRPEFYEGGLKAAQLLDSLLRHPRRKPVSATYGTLGIVERMSTADVGGVLRTVSLAKEFIRNHGTKGISVHAVATAARTSVRYLQTNFRNATGMTIVQAIQEARLSRVRELLKSTETPIASIARLTGFNNANYLKNLFKRKHGTSMSHWRAKSRLGQLYFNENSHFNGDSPRS